MTCSGTAVTNYCFFFGLFLVTNLKTKTENADACKKEKKGLISHNKTTNQQTSSIFYNHHDDEEDRKTNLCCNFEITTVFL